MKKKKSEPEQWQVGRTNRPGLISPLTRTRNLLIWRQVGKGSSLRSPVSAASSFGGARYWRSLSEGSRTLLFLLPPRKLELRLLARQLRTMTIH